MTFFIIELSPVPSATEAAHRDPGQTASVDSQNADKQRLPSLEIALITGQIT
jgi:hypothetical protein